MSNLRYTKGPYFGGENSEIQDSTRICASVPFKPGSDMVIASMNYYIKNWMDTRRLFMASPDMLDALIKCYKHIKNDMTVRGIGMNARRAIERATGQSIEEILK